MRSKRPAQGQIIQKCALQSLSITTPQIPATSDRETHAVKIIADILTDPPDFDERGFLPHALTLVTFPYRDPKVQEYTRRNGNLALTLLASKDVGLPFGLYPRLLNIHLTTEAVRTQSRDIPLGDSYRAFLRSTGLPQTGTVMQRFLAQTKSLLSCLISLHYETSGKVVDTRWTVASKYLLLWDPKQPASRSLFEPDSVVTLSQEYFDLTVNTAFPLDLRAVGYLAHFSRSPLAVDLYSWLVTEYYRLQHPRTVSFNGLMSQFGTSLPNTPQGRRDFKKALHSALVQVKKVYPEARFDLAGQGLFLLPSPVPIPPRCGRQLPF